MSRAVDDSGNLEIANAGVTVTVPPRSCPCTIWSSSATPGVASDADASAVELGVKFTSDVSGYITGIRFYKGSLNTGTHTGSLWSSSGALLATATFSGESASGWQQVNFSTAVAITANTTYVASYRTTVRHCSGNLLLSPRGKLHSPRYSILRFRNLARSLLSIKAICRLAKHTSSR